MTTKRALVGVFALVCVMFLAASLEAGGSKVKGNLYSLSKQSNTVTIKDSSGRLQTLNVGAAKLKRNGSSATMNSLVLGDKVSAQYNTGGLNPKKVKANGPKVSTVQGTLQGVNLGTSTIQVGGKSYRVTSRTRMIRNGQVASLGKLAAHDNIVLHVNGSGGLEDINCDGGDENEVEGTISAIDTTANTVTITPNDGSADVTVNVTSDTEIELNDEDATLADLAVGDSAEAEYDPNTMDAFSIEAETPEDVAEIHGTITAIDTTANTVTVQDDHGNSVTVNVTPTTMITLDGNPAFLTDLIVGDMADVQYNTTTMDAIQIDAETPQPQQIDGTITALDATAGTLTITGGCDGDCGGDWENQTVNLTVDSSTIILLDDAPATLADLAVGDEAEATYDPTTLVASVIEASSDGEDDAPVIKAPAQHTVKHTHGKSNPKQRNRQ